MRPFQVKKKKFVLDNLYALELEKVVMFVFLEKKEKKKEERKKRKEIVMEKWEGDASTRKSQKKVINEECPYWLGFVGILEKPCHSREPNAPHSIQSLQNPKQIFKKLIKLIIFICY